MSNPDLWLNDWCKGVHRSSRAILSPQLRLISYHFASFPQYFPHSGHCSLSLASFFTPPFAAGWQNATLAVFGIQPWPPWFPSLLYQRGKQRLLFTGEELTAPHQVNAILRSGPMHLSTVSSIIHDEGPSLPSCRAQVHASPF